jgi:GNAT superfamily N-acetyltransferase
MKKKKHDWASLQTSVNQVTLSPLTPDKLNEFRDLLGSSEFGGCFCAVWTTYGDDWGARCSDKSQPNFYITKKSVEEGKHTGYLVYQDSDLVGWTGSGQKTDFPFLQSKLGSRLSEFSEDIWSVGCLAIKASFRGKGIPDLIVRAVANEAAAGGAQVLEAYPTRRFHEPRIFRGNYTLYQRLGFVESGSEKDEDHEIVLMKLALRANRK